jgi:hypothetical protein
MNERKLLKLKLKCCDPKEAMVRFLFSKCIKQFHEIKRGGVYKLFNNSLKEITKRDNLYIINFLNRTNDHNPRTITYFSQLRYIYGLSKTTDAWWTQIFNLKETINFNDRTEIIYRDDEVLLLSEF